MVKAAPGKESIFNGTADYVSAAMGRPTNIVLVIGGAFLLRRGGDRIRDLACDTVGLPLQTSVADGACYCDAAEMFGAFDARIG